jgi:nicotinamide-nucleotide adenylyltransferase
MYKRVGIVGRFQPFHNGHLTILEAMCRTAEEVVICIGWKAETDKDNPFTVTQIKEMIEKSLRFSNYDIVSLEDIGHDQMWGDAVKILMGDLDVFVTGNDHVRKCLRDKYTMVAPTAYMSQIYKTHGKDVREKMRQDDFSWQEIVPPEAVQYIMENNILPSSPKIESNDCVKIWQWKDIPPQYKTNILRQQPPYMKYTVKYVVHIPAMLNSNLQLTSSYNFLGTFQAALSDGNYSKQYSRSGSLYIYGDKNDQYMQKTQKYTDTLGN